MASSGMWAISSSNISGKAFTSEKMSWERPASSARMAPIR